MIRALTIALCCAYAAALTPLSAAGDDNECALYLSGPGRTSAYDYSLNLLKGNFGYEGQHTCITYDAVNQAYLEARNRIVVAQPKGDWKAEDFASVGELLLDISISLARTYGLTYEEIEKGLPLIDTSRTLIREACPPIFSHVECRAGKYRRLDGLCTNLQHPTWGATMSPFQRLIGPLFADGINAPRISHTGHDLPLSRVVSRTMHPDDGFHDHAGTVMVIAWGQFMDHDYTLTGTPLDPVNRNDPEECCKRPPHLKHPYCNEIRVPDDDYFYRLFGVKCIDFVRGFPSPRPGCRLGSRVPFNTLTGVIDGNTVYGVTEKFARKLRTGFGGLLRMNPVFKEYGLKDLLPLKLDIPDEGCTRPNKNMYCFEAGEIRVNEQLVLTVMHTLMAREHNRVARGLAEVNPHWDDETLFQEARRINIAEIQHITYNEFLPILLGKDVMQKFGLVLEKEGYWDGYDSEVNPDVLDSFAAAAYRFGHSLLPTAVERWSKAHKFIASKRLSDLIRRPYDLYRAGVLDEYVMGLMNQVAQAMDDSITQEVTNHLFKKVGSRFGMDLVSFNMQRGREFGLPGYMEFRKFCGLSGADSFQDLFGSMSNETVHKYETIFEHPIDVDLWSGGVSERPLPGSMLGPTFACIIATQFSYSRRGDRFWYELPNQPSSFTQEQLTELRKARLARVICDNTDIIDTVQLYPMVLPDHELNPRVPCRSGIIPSMDFTKWAEPAPFHGAAKQFMTQAFVNASNGSSTEDKIKMGDVTIEKDSGCNDTLSNFNLDKNIMVSNVTVHNNTNSLLQNKTQNVGTTTNCTESNNEIKDDDTVLKYVYKKDDKLDSTKQKGAGHPKNSLKRKKRSENTETVMDTNVNESQRAPLIIDYKTSHDPSYVGATKSKKSDFNSHEPRFIEITEPTHKLTPGNVIKNANLADFNIETLHDKTHYSSKNNEKPKKNSNVELVNNPQRQNKESKESNENNSYQRDRSTESSEEYLHRENSKGSRREPKSDYYKTNQYKQNDEINKKDTDHRKDSNYYKPKNSDESYESTEKSDTENKKRTYSDESQENYRNTNQYHNNNKLKQHPSKESSESEESEEKYPKTYDRNIQSSHESSDKYRKPLENSNESSERESEPESPSYKKNYPNTYKKENQDNSRLVQSKENSDESNERNLKSQESTQSDYKRDEKELDNKSPAANVREADSGDFSYENIEINDKGQVVPSNDSNEKLETISPKEKTSNTFKQKAPEKTSEESREALPLPVKDYGTSNSGSNEDSVDIIKINVGEIRPVVEINSENNSNEAESENIKESESENKSSDRKSLESFLGVKELQNDDQNEKLQNKNEDPKEDVKQEFERIPLTYKHDEVKEKENKENIKTDIQESRGNTEIEDHPQNEGTLDTLTKPPRFDENLNFKFDDVAVTLPEIKLPEDILSYAYDASPYEKQDKEKNDRPKFYRYSDEYNDDKESDRKRDKNNNNNDENIGYGGYYRNYKDKDNYKKKNQEDEEDEDGENGEVEEDVDDNTDLYEKFVRERFGKRGTFTQRSENLQDQRPIQENPHLYERIQNILKKTQDVQKQAEKSGDPNAGYMWTLEYGQNL